MLLCSFKSDSVNNVFLDYRMQGCLRKDTAQLSLQNVKKQLWWP